MTKKRLILTQEQINEIYGGDFSYFDGLALTPDMGNVFANEVSAEGGLEDGYADQTTTDDYSHDMTNDWRGNAKLQGMGPITVREMTKKEWAKENLFQEESEHGNARLQHMTFGAKDGEQGKGYDATKMNLSRYNAAETKSKSTDPTLRQQGLSTMKTMERNWPGIKAAQTQYMSAKIGDKSNQKTIASAPKQSGNGKAHTPKNGIITNEGIGDRLSGAKEGFKQGQESMHNQDTGWAIMTKTVYDIQTAIKRLIIPYIKSNQRKKAIEILTTISSNIDNIKREGIYSNPRIY